MRHINTMAEVEALDRAAVHHETPCGDGVMVWRQWGRGVPVVLLHGGSGSWTHWVQTIPDLARDYEVWAADLPGLGDSAMPPEHVPHSAAVVVAEGLRSLIAHERQPRLVGFSFGAHVGTLSAGLVGGHIERFVIIGTSALGIQRPRMVFPKESSGMDEGARDEVHRAVLRMLMLSKPERIDDLAIALQADNVRKARFRSRKFAGNDTVRRGLKDVRVPLRSIWGRKDVVGYPNLETCLGILGEHHPELVAEIVEDAGHWVMYEQPEAFNAALRRMLVA